MYLYALQNMICTRKIITPRLNHSQMSINKSDELIEIIQLQSDKNAGITFNSKILKTISE